MKYRCMACGYIYDEEVEGTKFEELREHVTILSHSLPLFELKRTHVVLETG